VRAPKLMFAPSYPAGKNTSGSNSLGWGSALSARDRKEEL
jgi:hypothetical protein